VGYLTRREFLKLVGAGSAALAVGDRLLAAEAESRRMPSIIVILVDDLGYGELGCYGGKDVPTPNIDSLARNGVRFTNGYASCPVCSPTRAGLLTGRYQQRFGHEYNSDITKEFPANYGLPLSETTLATRLQAGGYATGMIGKWQLGMKGNLHPLKRGFDHFFGYVASPRPYDIAEQKEYLTDVLAREAKKFIEDHKEKPFFLYFAPRDVHGPCQPTDKYLDRFPNIKDKKRRDFCAVLSAFDNSIGDILGTLRKNELENDTLIFLLSDNGGATPETTSGNGPLRGSKIELYEGGIRVPFLVQWKGKLPAGDVCDSPVISLDIAPTALTAAGVKAENAKLDGVNLLPYLADRSKPIPHETLYWRYGNQHAIRHGKWKLLKMPSAKAHLFDLDADIGEKTNLAADKPEQLKELDAKLTKWESELIQPLWGPKVE